MRDLIRRTKDATSAALCFVSGSVIAEYLFYSSQHQPYHVTGNPTFDLAYTSIGLGYLGFVWGKPIVKSLAERTRYNLSRG